MTNKILIVDTSEHYRAIITSRLQSYGYENIMSARNGNEGYNKAIDESPELIIIDTRLPDIDGYYLCKQIRTISESHVKIVLLSSVFDKLDLSRAENAGADEIVVKTFDCMSLIVCVKKLIDQFQVV